MGCMYVKCFRSVEFQSWAFPTQVTPGDGTFPPSYVHPPLSIYQVPPGPSRQIDESWLVCDLGDGACVMQPVFVQCTQSDEYAQTPTEQWPFE